jgi:histidyl-tRNA synthetase
MADLQPVRGTHDLLPDDMRAHRHVSDTARGTAALHGFDEIATPIFEFTNVFARTLGDTSDVVTKEMYTFEDKGGDMLTLRPENTAGVCRAFISNGLAQHAPVKYFYSGPMFRHERPQKGRLRQFHQIGIELIGAAQPLADVEAIACGHAILSDLGIVDKTVLELNTLGDTESRAAYREALVEYFQGHLEKLSVESKDRLTRNPMRILDSKDEDDRKIVADAPIFSDYLNTESVEFFAAVKTGLDALGIKYTLNPRLVRGLDYYCHTAFEFTTDALGAQSAVMAGGRYDGLIGMLGSQETPGVGWAAGIERLAMLSGEAPPVDRPLVIVPMGDAAEAQALAIAKTLRGSSLRTEFAFSGNMKKRMKHANKVNAWAAIILGDEELSKGVAQVKTLDDGEQKEVAMTDLAATLTVMRVEDRG